MTAIRNKDTPLLKFKTSKDYPAFQSNVVGITANPLS